MSNPTADKDLLTDKALKRLQQLQRDVNRYDVKVLDELERYAASNLPQPSREDDDIRIASRYTKAEIKDAVAAERIFRLVTLDEWLEIARDFYQDSTGTKRRPKLLEDEFVTFLRLNDKHGSSAVIHPEAFLNAVWTLGKDPQIDHATFETLPWWGSDDDPHDGQCWQKYLSQSRDAFKVYWPPVDYEDEGYGHHYAAAEVQDTLLVPSPHCQPRIHMPKSQFAVYHFAVGLCHKDGECWLSRETTGKWCNMHPQTVRTAIDWLVKQGWLVEIKAPRKGVGGQGRYSAVSHADWVAAHGSTSCVQVTNGEKA